MQTKILPLTIVLLYTALILYLSSIPGSPKYQLPYNTDKIVHIIEYAVLGFLVSYLLKAWGIKHFVIIGWVFITILGISDEAFQLYTPYRDSTVFDVCADSIGAFLGLILYSKISKN